MPTLHWLTREQDLKATANAEYRLLVEDEKLSCGDPDSRNLIVQGDNLEALKALLPFYAGQVKCIYIDPPYNTGSAFEHYDDNMEHTKWLSMMYPRLELLKQFMREDGVLFVSIDDREEAYLKVVLDEIFGRNNFVANITVVSDARTRNYQAISPTHEFILAYSKSENYLLFQSVDKEKSFPYYDELGGFELYELRNRNASFNIYNRPNLFYPFYLNPQKKDKNDLYEISLEQQDGWIEVIPQKSGDIQTVWRQSKDTVTSKLNTIIFGKASKNGYQIVKKYREITKPFSTVWNEKEMLSDRGTLELKTLFGKKIFDFPKPEELIERVLTLSTQKGDIVLDSFLGSGTTAAVAHKMERRYIGIEMGEQSKTHCAVRLKKVIEGEQGGISKALNWKGGGGFRFFTLGDAVFDKDRRIKEDISFENLAAHIYFTETKKPMTKCKNNSTFLGIHEDTAYALLYNGILGDKKVDSGNVLTYKTLNHIMNDINATAKKIKAKLDYNQLVIYGEATRLTRVSLEDNNIIFKQTPYNIKVW